MTDAEWEPANETERAMAEAMVAGNHQEYFQILGAADLYLPQFLKREAAGQVFVTADLFGHTFLPVFTSIEAMIAGVSDVADGYTVTNYPELRRKWPSPEWRLAVNPGTPIDAYVAVEAVQDAAVGDVSIPTAGEVLAEAAAEADDEPPPPPAVDVDEELIAAAERGDGEAYLRTLLDALVIMPTARPVADGSELFEPDFPWRKSETGTIDVFTSERLFSQFNPPGTPSLTVSLPYLLALWPDESAMAVNPGSQFGVELPGDQVRTLLLWGD